MRNIALFIEYDGTDYSGWQFQPNAPTVQEEIETAISRIAGKRIPIIGAGRTDAGVHASFQVASMQFGDDFNIPFEKIPIAINSKLPKDIRIFQVAETVEAFNARYSAVERQYSYFLSKKYSVFNRRFTSLINLPFDEEKLLISGELFLGEHDFTAFSKNNPDTKSYVCTINKCEWKKLDDGSMELTIAANRFVYGMVRAIVGAMLDFARNKKKEKNILQSLDEPNRFKISALAPPEGLILSKIIYPKELFVKFS